MLYELLHSLLRLIEYINLGLHVSIAKCWPFYVLNRLSLNKEVLRNYIKVDRV